MAATPAIDHVVFVLLGCSASALLSIKLIVCFPVVPVSYPHSISWIVYRLTRGTQSLREVLRQIQALTAPGMCGEIKPSGS